MKKPEIPPSVDDLLKRLSLSPARLAELLFHAQAARGEQHEYFHWDELRRRPPPGGLSHEEWWLATKLRRRTAYQPVALCDKSGRPFRFFSLTESMQERLHRIDLGVGGRIDIPDQVMNPDTRDRYYVSSLIEEAITSSQIEGASTTRPVAKEMIRSGREPRDRSERMILNNYVTMRRIGELKQERLTPELLCELHRLVTERTLDNPSAAGRLRQPDEPIHVADQYDETLHTPPGAEELEGRLEAMCDFANQASEGPFIHPVLRAIILHFWLAYDHPFVDGNGRTARSLFYWSMLHHGYWLCEFISISQIIRKAPVKYTMAFLHTETDDNDLTYFIHYHLDVIDQAVKQLHAYIARKTRELRVLEQRLRAIEALNHRQRALIEHALRHPGQRYTIESHRRSHDVVYQTARADLLDLEARGLLVRNRIGKRFQFSPSPNLESLLQRP